MNLSPEIQQSMDSSFDSSSNHSMNSALQNEYEQLLANTDISPLLILNNDKRQLSDDFIHDHSDFSRNQSVLQDSANLQKNQAHKISAPSSPPQHRSEPTYNYDPKSAEPLSTLSSPSSSLPRNPCSKATTTTFAQHPFPTNSSFSAQKEVHPPLSSSNADTDLVRLDGELEKWTVMLKRAVLGEFSHMKTEFIVRYEKEYEEEKKRMAAQNSRLYEELENLKED
eukprot:Sdes_comp16476_c0_seq1m5798